MGWVVHQYVNRYIHDYKSLKPEVLVRPSLVDPGLWTPMNFLARFWMVNFPSPNFGFVYGTCGHVINDIIVYYNETFQTLPDNMDIVVKHVSALLSVSYQSSLISIEKLLMMESIAKDLSEAKLAYRKLADRTTGSSLDGAVTSSSPAALNHVTLNVLSIKHAYLGVLYLNKYNPLLVMRNVGKTLDSLFNTCLFKLEWRRKPLRR